MVRCRLFQGDAETGLKDTVAFIYGVADYFCVTRNVRYHADKLTNIGDWVIRLYKKS